MTSISGASSTCTKKSQRSDNRSTSGDTVCTSNSSCILQRRKPANPLAYSVRPMYSNKAPNSVKQRVMSAKLLKMRSIQNQLNDVNFHLAELTRENQALKILQKRQDKALAKYENTNAELPKLLRSHEEEIRVLSEKNKTARQKLKDLTDQLKTRDEELKRTRELLNHYEKLNKDKHLVERERLSEQVEDLKVKLQKSEEQVSLLNRKIMLETKSCKQKLNTEMVKHKKCQRDLIDALQEIDRLVGILDIQTKENVPHSRSRLSTRLSHRQASSLIALDSYPTQRFSSKDALRPIRDEDPDTPDIKLEPIECKKESANSNAPHSILKPPIESIKHRLSGSAGALRTKESNESVDIMYVNQNGVTSEMSIEARLSAGSHNARPHHSSVKLKKLPNVFDAAPQAGATSKTLSTSSENNGSDVNEEDSDINYDEDESDSNPELEQLNETKKVQFKNSISKPESDDRFEELTTALDNAIEKTRSHKNDEFGKKLGEYCTVVVGNVKKCHDTIESHKESLQKLKLETNTIEESFIHTENMESKLKKSFFAFDEGDMEIVKDILSEEFKFQAAACKNKTDVDKMREPKRVNSGEKKKLLATLRAIDNGDSIESLNSNPPQRQTRLMTEIFGDVSQ